MSKIGIVSFCYEAKQFNLSLRSTNEYKKKRWHRIEDYTDEFNARRFELLEEIAGYAEEEEMTHLLFPGTTLAYCDDYEWKALEKDVGRFGRIFDKFSAIAEFKFFGGECLSMPHDMGIVTYSKGKEVGERIQQIFAKSGDNKILYHRLWTETALWGHRIRELDGIKFLIWVCGENSFLKNYNKPSIRVSGPRHPIAGKKVDPRKLDYDVFYNPVHTPFKGVSAIDKMKGRIKYMSTRNRVGIISLNVPCFQKQRNNSMFCYIDGEEMDYHRKSNWEKKKWVMETIDVKI